MRKRPGRGRGQAAKSRRRHGVPKTGTYGAEQEGAAETKRQQNAEEGVPTHRTGSTRAEQAAGAAPPPDWGIRGQVAARRPRQAHPGRNKEQGLPRDWIIRGQAAAERHGLDHPGWIKRHEPPHPGLHPVMQWGKQEAEAEVKVSSSHEDVAMAKQCGSQDEEPAVMQ